MNDFWTPTSVANEALSACGSDFVLGDLEEGTDHANTVLRHYYPALTQLLRTAGWNFARKQAPLLLLADATGQTTGVSTLVPGAQFIYSYAYPTDCAFLRYIPWNPFFNVPIPEGNIVPPDSSAPLMPGLGQSPNNPQRVVPARFLVTTDINNIPAGAANDAAGISPIGRTVILTNVKFAQAIYTFEATYPNLWSSQFREAMVAYLASLICLQILPDKKFALTMRAQNIAIAKEKIKAARVSEGKESFSNSDLQVDWMRFRNSGGYGGWASWWSNVGEWNCSWDAIGGGTANSSAY